MMQARKISIDAVCWAALLFVTAGARSGSRAVAPTFRIAIAAAIAVGVCAAVPSPGCRAQVAVSCLTFLSRSTGVHLAYANSAKRSLAVCGRKPIRQAGGLIGGRAIC
jgi:hypothetical protein